MDRPPRPVSLGCRVPAEARVPRQNRRALVGSPGQPRIGSEGGAHTCHPAWSFSHEQQGSRHPVDAFKRNNRRLLRTTSQTPYTLQDRQGGGSRRGRGRFGANRRRWDASSFGRVRLTLERAGSRGQRRATSSFPEKPERRPTALGGSRGLRLDRQGFVSPMPRPGEHELFRPEVLRVDHQGSQ